MEALIPIAVVAVTMVAAHVVAGIIEARQQVKRAFAIADELKREQMIAPDRPKILTLDISANGGALIVKVKWENGRYKTWAYEPGEEAATVCEVWKAVADGSITPGEARFINDEILKFMEGCSNDLGAQSA